MPCLFLAKGGRPVLINKLRHGPAGDWNNDPDDIRNLVSIVSRDWKKPADLAGRRPGIATLPELLQAPIIFFNGHQAPEFSPAARQNMREFVEQGGFMFAEACCGETEFDQGFRRLMKEIFPEPESSSSRSRPSIRSGGPSTCSIPRSHPLWGIEHGCRTVVIYSPMDLPATGTSPSTAPRTRP